VTMSEEDTHDRASQTIGERLRAGRELKQLSREDLANMLHLQVTIIDALETDQFDRLAAPTYTKGYIRSVARHLDLDSDELIRLFDSGASTGSGPEILPQVSRPSQFSSTDKPVKIMTYLISLGLVLLLLIWWQGEFIVDHGNQQVDTNAVSAGGPYPGGFDYTYPSIIHPDDPFYRAPDSTIDAPGDTGADTPGPAANPPILDIDEGVGPATPAAETADSTTVEAPVAGTSSTGLVITVNEEAWIEIRDANDEKLYLDIAKPGETIEVDGQLPLSVVLGNAEGVSVNWNGKPYDLGPHSSAGVARFQLGE